VRGTLVLTSENGVPQAWRSPTRPRSSAMMYAVSRAAPRAAQLDSRCRKRTWDDAIDVGSSLMSAAATRAAQ